MSCPTCGWLISIPQSIWLQPPCQLNTSAPVLKVIEGRQDQALISEVLCPCGKELGVHVVACADLELNGKWMLRAVRGQQQDTKETKHNKHHQHLVELAELEIRNLIGRWEKACNKVIQLEEKVVQADKKVIQLYKRLS